MKFDISCASQSNSSKVNYVAHNKGDLSRLQFDWLIFPGWKYKVNTKQLDFQHLFPFSTYNSVHKEGVLCLRNNQRGVIKCSDVESMRNFGAQFSDSATLSIYVELVIS